MDATKYYHTKWSKSETGRLIPYDSSYMWNLKYDTNELIYKAETDSQTQRADLWFPRGRGRRGEKDWEFEVSRCKLYIKETNNKDPLYRTGNCIQYLIITYNGKESEKE